MLTAKSQVKEILKESELGIDNIAADFMGRLEEEVRELVLKAAKRAKENNRRTIMARDV